MDDKTRQSLGLLVVAALAGLVWLLARTAGAGPDGNQAAYMVLIVAGGAAVIFAVVALVRLATDLLRH